MHTNTINNTHSITNDASQSARFVRSASASNAHGFAQIMHTFGSESESEIAESIEKNQDSETSTEQSQPNDESVSAQPESADTADVTVDTDDQAQVNPDSQSEARPETDDSVDAQPIQGEQANTQISKEPKDNTQASEASLRLLDNQSEQAKLSIKGLVRSLTQGSGADTTAIAVDTRLGRNQTEQSQITQEQSATPEISKSTLPNQAQTNTKTDHEPAPRTNIRADMLGSESSQSIQTDPRMAQSTVVTGQIASQQVDVAGAVSQTQSNTLGADATRTVINQSANRLAGMNQAQQAVRVISAVDAGNSAGNVGHQQTDSNPGSLVERMKSSAMPDQAKRAGVIAQVQRGLASLLRSGNSEMTLKLTPGNLGEVRIRIKSTSSGLSVRFETSSNEATETLNSSVKDLGANLRLKGINIDQIHIENTSSQNTPASEVGIGNGNASSQESNEQANHEHAQHQNNKNRFESEYGEVNQPEDPESIWTELGLDAIA